MVKKRRGVESRGDASSTSLADTCAAVDAAARRARCADARGVRGRVGEAGLSTGTDVKLMEANVASAVSHL